MSTPLPTPPSQLAFDELGSPLRAATFVVVDLETTGGSATADAVTEIGAVKIRGGEVLGEFGTLVDPERGIPPNVVSITGITDVMVTGAPRMASVLPAFLEFAAGAVLVAHNSAFDIGFLRAACERHGHPWPKPAVLCTVRLARRVLTRDEAPSCSLASLARHFRVDTLPTHRALDDARATVGVLHALFERLGPLGVHSVEELLGFLPEVTPAQRRKRELAAGLPHAPGVYLFRGPSEEVLYVGTASDLRRRVRQYFTGGERRARVREMVGLAVRVDHVECAHPLEAEVRELRLIAAHRPQYNRRSKAPHGGWWLTLTDEAFPRLSLVREPRAGAIGPFGSRRRAADAMDAVQDALPLRRCTDRIPARNPRGTPCALAELDKCGAPCAGRQSVAEYAPAVDALRAMIAGHSESPLWTLRSQLDELVEAQRFEDAAARRDRLAALLRALDRNQRLAALAAIPELVAAERDDDGGWRLAVVRHGRLAAAGTAARGVPPLPVVDQLVASAETVLPGAGPLYGASSEEVAVLCRWLGRRGVRLVRCAQPWAEPARSAASWRGWVALAAAGRAGYAAAD